MILWSEEGTQYYASDDSGSPVAIETKDDGTFEIDGTYTFCAGNTATSTIFLGEEGVPVTASGSACHLTLSSDYKSINITNNAEDEQLASVSQRIASVHATKIDIYDSQGNAHVLETSFEKIDNNQWRWRAWFPDESIALSSNTGIIEFNADGLITSESNPGPITANFASLGAEDEEITLDFTGESFNEDEIEGVTQYGSEFTTKGYYQDGYSMGVLEDFSISQDGTITGVYDNGENKALYRMALALFTNPQGLQKVGDTTFMKTSNSGVPQDVPATQGGSGKIAGQSLEMSNVDLSQQFTSLIKGQRGFQANARVVTTSDSVLEELVNLKR
ncbi:MAG: flagellar hook-basal body complex protein [Synergistales bacterium]|nr:flagellar hook-basal body complex protein [Synergistales bacterium]